MGQYEAEVRSVKDGGSPGADPSRLLLAHHRSGEAEVRIGMLSGGHLLHLAVAGCVYNSVFRIAADRGIALRDCRVTVEGGFDDAAPRSAGITYEIEVAGAAPADELRAIAHAADTESTIPNLLRASAEVVLQRVLVRAADEAEHS